MDRLAPFKVIDDFAAVTTPGAYTPLPDGWLIGLTDVVGSYDAIGEGHYKAVNMAGAAAISGLINALGTRDVPFIFAGDGCAFVVPPQDEALAHTVLGRTAAWSRRELGLTLRAALVPIGDIRAAGHDVTVALFMPSPHVTYAMFDGGGIAYAEAQMKAGKLHVPPDDSAPPDLTGLSCRWLPMGARNGAVLSLIARAGPAGEGAFRQAVDHILALLEPADLHPVPPSGPPPAFISPGVDLEARAAGGDSPLWRRKLAIRAHTLFGWALFCTRLKLGSFDPAHYRKVASVNADARKFDDGLMLTLDASEQLIKRLTASLDAAKSAGALVYGLHRQNAALMTCIVPSYTDDGHLHFIDGAGGGYAQAAQALGEA